MTKLTTLPTTMLKVLNASRNNYPRASMFSEYCNEATLNSLKSESNDTMIDEDYAQQLMEYISIQLLEGAESDPKKRDVLIRILENLKLFEMLEERNLVLVLD